MDESAHVEYAQDWRRPWNDRLISGRGLASAIALDTGCSSSPLFTTRPTRCAHDEDQELRGREEERRGSRSDQRWNCWQRARVCATTEFPFDRAHLLAFLAPPAILSCSQPPPPPTIRPTLRILVPFLVPLARSARVTEHERRAQRPPLRHPLSFKSLRANSPPCLTYPSSHRRRRAKRVGGSLTHVQTPFRESSKFLLPRREHSCRYIVSQFTDIRRLWFRAQWTWMSAETTHMRTCPVSG